MDTERITFSRHAEQRMSQRHFTESDVRYALNHAHTRYPDHKGNPCFVATLPDERRIEVVLDDRRDPPHVITVID